MKIQKAQWGVKCYPCPCYAHDKRCDDCQDKARRMRDPSLCAECHMAKRAWTGKLCRMCRMDKTVEKLAA